MKLEAIETALIDSVKADTWAGTRERARTALYMLQTVMMTGVKGDREAFEAWARTADMPLSMYSATDYADGATQISWDAWQARAALTAPAQPCGDAEQADEAVTRDAERYRWLRQHRLFPSTSTFINGVELDAALDAARAKDSK